MGAMSVVTGPFWQERHGRARTARPRREPLGCRAMATHQLVAFNTALDSDNKIHDDEVAQRFGFTGGHWHWNWADPNCRKLVLNAIVWVAHGEVPAGGVACTGMRP